MRDNLLTSKKERNGIIDALKGICILIVIITHISWSEEQRRFFLFPFLIDMAVPVFIIVQGYLLTASYERSGIEHIKDAYNIRRLGKALLRFLLPYLIIVLCELIGRLCVSSSFVHSFLANRGVNTSEIDILSPVTIIICLKIVLTGGLGPGSFYTPVLCQIVFIYPLIYLMLKKNPTKGLVLVFFVNILYEILKNICHMNADLYRLVAFRYLFLISLGVYSYYKKNTPKIVLLVSFLLGCTYITLTGLTGYVTVIFKFWTSTSMMTGLFIGPVVYMIFRLSEKRCSTVIFLSNIGMASFDIYLIQMAYFYFVPNVMRVLIPKLFFIKCFQILLGIIICVPLGWLLYKVENPITRKLCALIHPSRKAVIYKDV